MNTKLLVFLVLLSSQLFAEQELLSKQAFVTGGSSGIGRAIVIELVKEGADVVFTYHSNKERAESLIKELAHHKRTVKALHLDITDDSSVQRCLKTVLEIVPNISVVVNNAAILTTRSFLETSQNEFDKIQKANVSTPLVISQTLAKYMINKKIKGSIINVGSFRGGKPVSRLFAYSSSKANLEAISKMMASELAPKSIRVNVISPGGTLTEMSRQIYNTQEKVVERGKKVPLGRYGQPEDHVGAVVYLASDKSSWTTGAVITIDGGESTANG